MRLIHKFSGGRLLFLGILALLFVGAAIALFFTLPWLLPPLALAERALALAAAVRVCAQDALPESRLARTVLAIALPFAGAAFCFAFRPIHTRSPRTHAPDPRPAAPAENGSAPSAPDGESPGVSPVRADKPAKKTRGALSDAAKQAPDADKGTVAAGAAPKAAEEAELDETFLRFVRVAGADADGADTADYYPTGAQWRIPFLADLANAKREILLEYYIVAQGVLWDGIFRVLRKRAQHGVRVMLLFDAFGCALTLPSHFVKEMRRAGIAAKPFRALAPRISSARRDHKKLALIDGRIAYVGGINLADEYVGEKIRFGHWKDSALRLTGAVACRFRQMFFHAWGEKMPPYETDGTCPLTHFAHTMSAAALSDDAEGRIPRAGVRVLHEMCARAKKRLYLCTPYLMPDSTTMRALMLAAAGGTDVRIAVPYIPDKKSIYLMTKRCARLLEAGGVSVRAYRAGFLHAKSVVCDGRYVLVGSWNLDFRSLYAQSECGALAADETLAQALERDFLETWQQSDPLPQATIRERFAAALMLPFCSLV